MEVSSVDKLSGSMDRICSASDNGKVQTSIRYFIGMLLLLELIFVIFLFLNPLF